MNNERGLQRGKDFEEIIKKDFLKVPDTTVERLPDPVQGYLGVRNPCDFIVYHYPNIYYIECKTTHSHRLPFGNITFNQRTLMLEASKVKGVIAGLIVWFIPCEKTYFIPIQLIEKYRLEGVKSLNVNSQDTSEWIGIRGDKKRIFYDYDLEWFFNKCILGKVAERNYLDE
jgi:penicillin-binding protein-related factor A (putative recombinase)